MPTYNVPVERRSLPNSDPLRWLILTVDAATPAAAAREATRIARKEMRLADTTIWAAVAYIPSFEHMQELRDEMDAMHARIRAPKVKHRDAVRTSMNTFTSAAFA